MELDGLGLINGKLSNSVREHRRKNNLCMYDGCSQPNNCKRLKEKEDQKAAPAKMNATSVTWSIEPPKETVTQTTPLNQ